MPTANLDETDVLELAGIGTNGGANTNPDPGPDADPAKGLWRAVLVGDMSLVLMDPNGKAHKALPKTGGADDEGLWT